jgi:hypothetical protein
MQARSLAPLGATFLALACSPDAPPTPLAPADRVDRPLTETQVAAATLPNSGILKMCLVAGAGLPAGQSFTSAITLAGVTRSLTNTTGGCAELEVPRERTPQGKGWFRSNVPEVERVLPGSTTLVIDGAALDRQDVLDVLSGPPNVEASSSLVLNLAQQLIAAQLNLLRGVQASSAVNQAVTDAHAALQITLGTPTTIASSLSTARASALVSTLTSFNEGKTKPPAPPPTVTANIVQAAVLNVEVASIGCEPATSCDGADRLTGEVVTTLASGSITSVTFTNQSKPILRVCVVAGSGVAAGTMSHFDARRVGELGFLSFDVPAGDCREAEAAEDAEYEMSQTKVAGIRVASIACDPFTHCSRNFPEDQSVAPFVSRGITTITFTNRSALGTMRICKVAGPGLGTDKQFTIAVNHFSIVPLPGEPTFADAKLYPGQCVDKTLLEGTGYEVREFNDFPAITLASITCEPAGRCGGLDPSRGVAAADIVAGSTTTVNVTNRSTLGTLRVCVSSSGGINPPTAFNINVNPDGVVGGPGEPTSATPSVQVGTCQDITLKEGIYQVSDEPLGPQYVADGVDCEPTTRCSSFFPSSVKAEIVPAATTTVTLRIALSDYAGEGGERRMRKIRLP